MRLDEHVFCRDSMHSDSKNRDDKADVHRKTSTSYCSKCSANGRQAVNMRVGNERRRQPVWPYLADDAAAGDDAGSSPLHHCKQQGLG